MESGSELLTLEAFFCRNHRSFISIDNYALQEHFQCKRNQKTYKTYFKAGSKASEITKMLIKSYHLQYGSESPSLSAAGKFEHFLIWTLIRPFGTILSFFFFLDFFFLSSAPILRLFLTEFKVSSSNIRDRYRSPLNKSIFGGTDCYENKKTTITVKIHYKINHFNYIP